MGQFDNITYLMEKVKSGDKQRSQEELQAMADEQNRQFQLLGVNTQVKVWPKNKPFNPKYLDKTDNVALLGSRNAQTDFIKSTYPEEGKSEDWNMTSDVGRSGTLKINDFAHKGSLELEPGKYAMIDDAEAKKLAGNNVNPVLAFLLNHEVIHNFTPSNERGGHTLTGIMAEGNTTTPRLTGANGITKRSVDYLDSQEDPSNQTTRDYIIAVRQHGKKDQLPSDNYDINKENYNKESAIAYSPAQTLVSTKTPELLYNKLVNIKLPYRSLRPINTSENTAMKKFGGILYKKKQTLK